MNFPVNKSTCRLLGKFQEFDFSLFDFDEEVTRFIQFSIDILIENLLQQFLLFDEICKTDCTNDNLSDKGRLKMYLTN